MAAFRPMPSRRPFPAVPLPAVPLREESSMPRVWRWCPRLFRSLCIQVLVPYRRLAPLTLTPRLEPLCGNALITLCPAASTLTHLPRQVAESRTRFGQGGVNSEPATLCGIKVRQWVGLNVFRCQAGKRLGCPSRTGSAFRLGCSGRFSITLSIRPNSLAISAVRNISRSKASSIFLSGWPVCLT